MRIKVIYFALLIISIQTFGQKRPLTINDFAQWKNIQSAQISNNGDFVVYELNKQHGDGNIVIYNTRKKTNDTIKLAKNASISPNSDFLVFTLYPAQDTLKKAKLAKVKKDKLPKDSVGVYRFSDGFVQKFPNVKSYKVAKENASWAAILIKYQKPENDTAKNDSLINKKKKSKNDVNELIILNNTMDSLYRFINVDEFTISKNGKSIAFTTQTKDSVNLGSVFVFNTETTITDTIFSDTCMVKKVTLDNTGTQCAFLFSMDTVKNKTYTLQYQQLGNDKSYTIDTLAQGLHPGFCPSEQGKIFFSDDGSKLFFGAAKQPVNEAKDTALEEEKPKLDVWSWTDKQLQPEQLINLEKDKKQTYLSVFHIKKQKIVQLADSINKWVTLINKGNGNVALTGNDENYARASSWNGRWLNDYFLVDVNTGNKTAVCQGISNAWISPAGNYVVYYNLFDSVYYSWNAKKNTTIALTKNIPTPFYYELNDMPTDPFPYGIAGWTEDGKSVFIYDRYDIWKMDLSGESIPVNITAGYGRKTKTEFRYVKLDPDLINIPDQTPVILKGFNQETIHDGYFKTTLNHAQNPQVLVSGPYRYSYKIKKAKYTDALFYQRQNTQQYPNIYLSNLNFTDYQIISDANPQQKNYNWATAELVTWTSFTGEKLRGILYKPENFDPGKKYPMLVYFYELLSNNLHRHYTPYPSHSTINKLFYASQGYLVFVPDITYNIGYPGQSAYNAIISGVNYLTTKYTYINKDKMALQGQSWGGYQTAYLVTQTDMFAAAMAGAPVSNMTSAYGGIRWGSGMSRMFQYEHTQSRIGGNLWDKPLLYIENSPVFHAPKVNTPLLIMHNDNDGAVPWYQGIEYFVALRRLNKPVWMLNYNGMHHNIESKYWANRVDLSTRMLQFFDHYLKDKPAPEWMTKGIPAIEKGKNLGY